jgi:glycosyltransferase involved in cell wall biosynthesis
VTRVRVLFVSPRYYPDPPGQEHVGGSHISAHHLAQALVTAGVDLRVLSLMRGSARVDERQDGVSISRMPVSGPAGPPWLTELDWVYRQVRRQVLALLSEFRPDLIHAYSGRAVPGVARAARRAGRPFVATVSSPYLLCATAQGTDGAGRDCLGCRGGERLRAIMAHSGPRYGAPRAVLYWLFSYPHMAHLARSLRRAALLLPDSHGIARDLARLGYPAERIRVVHDPITVPSRVDRRRPSALGLPDDARVLMYAGRLVENKGVQNVLGVMPALPNTVMLVIGRGDHEPALRRRAAELGLTERVRFLGFIPNAALGEYYAAADVVIMAGTFYEALGRMLMEACAHGVPVIGTRVGGIPDVIEDGRNGFLLDSQDPAELRTRIETILASSHLAGQMGEYGRAKMAREFSAPACARALIDAYRLAAAGRSRGQPDGFAPDS